LRKEPARVLAFVNQKGGTGKTTLAQNLAVCFGRYYNKRVLCVDLDPQGNLGQGLLNNQIDTPKTADRLLVVPKANVSEYIVTVRPNIDIIQNRFQKELHEAVGRLPLYPDLLKRQLGPALMRYDYIIIDTPSGLCRSTQIGIEAANQVILTVSCGTYGLKGMVAMIDWMLGNSRRLIKPMPSIRVAMNNYSEWRRFDRDLKLELQRIFGDELLQTHIRASERLIEAAAQGVSIVESDHDHPVTKDFKWLSREILGLPLEMGSSVGPLNGNRVPEGDVAFETMAVNSTLYNSIRLGGGKQLRVTRAISNPFADTPIADTIRGKPLRVTRAISNPFADNPIADTIRGKQLRVTRTISKFPK
jgi:chromosome partitioning protein